jgi:hypothetical protein
LDHRRGTIQAPSGIKGCRASPSGSCAGAS